MNLGLPTRCRWLAASTLRRRPARAQAELAAAPLPCRPATPPASSLVACVCHNLALQSAKLLKCAILHGIQRGIASASSVNCALNVRAVFIVFWESIMSTSRTFVVRISRALTGHMTNVTWSLPECPGLIDNCIREFLSVGVRRFCRLRCKLVSLFSTAVPSRALLFLQLMQILMM